MQVRLRRPSPAMAVAMAALFVALSGAAYAATLAKDSVGAKQIKKNGVRATEIKDGAVGANEIPDGSLTGADVQNESLKSADVDGLASGDIADESLNGGDVEDGTLGSGDVADESLTGGDVADGAIGSGDVADDSLGSGDVQGLTRGDFAAGELPGPVTVQRTDGTVADNTTGSVEATCPAGQQAISGGASLSETGSDDIRLMVSRPGNGGFVPNDGETFNDWRAVYRNPAGGTTTSDIRVFVICIATS